MPGEMLTLQTQESFTQTPPLFSPLQTVFRETMLGEFLTVLMQVLVHKSHDLLQEEIVITVYNMANVDFDTFYNKFLPHFLQSMDGLDNNQRMVLVQNFKQEKVMFAGLLAVIS